MTKRECHCAECNAVYEPAKAGQRFCSATCSKAFNNRRMTRGAILLDLLMTDYTNRQHPMRESGTLQKVARRLLSRWRDEDRAAGREHCADPTAMIRNDMTLTMDAIYADRNPWSRHAGARKAG